MVHVRIPLARWAAGLVPPLNQRQAARLCHAGRVPGAVRDPWGRWLVPTDEPDPRLPVGRPRVRTTADPP